MKGNINREYDSIVKDILENENFKVMGEIEHHNTTRLDHMMKVSYYSYLVARMLHLNYRDVARGGLLHDFYLGRTVDHNKVKDKVKLYTHNHPKEALENAKKHFDINAIVEDIIGSHMFPIDIKIPKYAESWVVSTVDKVIGTYEFYKKASTKIKYGLNFSFLLFINILTIK